MRNLIFILFIASACTNIKNKVTETTYEKPVVVEENFVYQVEDVVINNGKVKYVSFETNLEDGLFEMNCFGENSQKSFYKVLVQEKVAKSYIAESYFSLPTARKCFLKGEHVINLSVSPFNNKSEKLNVPKGKIDLSKEDLARVIREKEIKRNMYEKTADTYLFETEFDVPLSSFITSHYGNVRLFNNKKRSQHLGNDFRAAVGVPIPAANRGRVVFTGNLFFSGNLVVLDHGLDIFTLYGHLSKIRVNLGDMVNKGDIVGTAGKTGRVSGPHLHWGVRIGGHSVDGFSLVRDLISLKIMKWQNSVQVFIDPFIKENNKYLTERAEHLGTQHGYQIIFDKYKIKDLLSAKIILFEELTESIQELAKNPSHYFIQLDQPNLDLFSAQEKLKNSFNVQDEVQLESVFGVIQIILDNSASKLKKIIVNEGLGHLAKLLQVAKEQVDLTSDQTLIIDRFGKNIFELYEITEIVESLELLSPDLVTQNLSIKTLGDILFERRQENFIPLNLTTENTLFLCWQGKTVNAKEIALIYQVLEECFKNHSVLLDSIEARLKWESRLSNFDLPIVTFDEIGEILIHNKHFVELNISTKECLSFSHNDQITIRKNIYRVIKKNTQNSHQEFIFVPVNDFLVQSDRPSYEELGIISSSVAHELNNPLAGISAALDLLLLDDFSPDTVSELKEMKKGVHRCRNLVEIFLGFSKVKSELVSPNTKNIEVESVFSQAVELIRFRLIENNVTLKVNFKQRQNLQVQFDESVMTMIFYLLLGEILTSFSHHKLVVRGGSKQLSIGFEEESESLKISFSKDISLATTFLDSKLISHLFDLMNSQVKLENNTIKINL